LESVASCAKFVANCAARAEFSPARAREIELIIEEVLVNICRHAYCDTPGEVELNCSETDSQHLLLEVIDQGREFNILDVATPDLNSDVEHRVVGGLGIPLIRAIADAVTYSREGDRNVLRLTLRMAR
jgi:anti-sigma regulatory factor (Ser/Thr protein kinase)